MITEKNVQRQGLMSNSNTFTNLVDRSRFCRDLNARYPWWHGKPRFESIEDLYDLVFDQVAWYLHEDIDNRVALPKIGALYTSIVPENPRAGLPVRFRYRLACKAQPLNPVYSHHTHP